MELVGELRNPASTVGLFVELVVELPVTAPLMQTPPVLVVSLQLRYKRGDGGRHARVAVLCALLDTPVAA